MAVEKKNKAEEKTKRFEEEKMKTELHLSDIIYKRRCKRRVTS
jgi:hypothetical protein